MTADFAALSSVALKPGTVCQQPVEESELVHFDSPAVEVMTDFTRVIPIAVGSDIAIGEALEKMRIDGIRMLLVTADSGSVVGLITARDIQGEKPIQLIQETGIPHADISVQMIMTPQESITALNMISVRNAEVGHIVRTLHDQLRQHALVVEVDEAKDVQVIRGMFSTTHISRLLGQDVSTTDTGTFSLADITHELA